MTAPGILVTRPADQSHRLAEALRQRDYLPILAPCLALAFRDGPPLDLADIGTVAVSSANGAAALARRTIRRDLPLFAVGTATAAALQAAGFHDIEVAAGDAVALLALLQAKADRTAAILHVSGEEVACDLASALTESGFRARREILYAMEPVSELPAPALQALDRGEAAAVLLMSARTAREFATLVMTAGRQPTLSNVTAVCLSPAVAAVARETPYRSVEAAAEPTQLSLLERLETSMGRG